MFYIFVVLTRYISRIVSLYSLSIYTLPSLYFDSHNIWSITFLLFAFFWLYSHPNFCVIMSTWSCPEFCCKYIHTYFRYLSSIFVCLRSSLYNWILDLRLTLALQDTTMLFFCYLMSQLCCNCILSLFSFLFLIHCLHHFLLSFFIFIMISQTGIFVTKNFFYPQFCGHQTKVNILLYISYYLYWCI